MNESRTAYTIYITYKDTAPKLDSLKGIRASRRPAARAAGAQIIKPRRNA